MTLAQIKKWVS